jgi:hypothetical protein
MLPACQMLHMLFRMLPVCRMLRTLFHMLPVCRMLRMLSRTLHLPACPYRLSNLQYLIMPSSVTS